jgi:hypothetical protein
MTKLYLSIDYATGRLFESSKAKKEGFEEHVNSKNAVSYRRYYESGIYGKLDNIGLRNSDFGKQIGIKMSAEGYTFYVQMNLNDQKGFVSNGYTESLIKILPNLLKGETYTLRPYSFLPKDEQGNEIPGAREVKGISFKNGADIKIEALLTNERISKTGTITPGDIPALVFEQNALGEVKPTAVSQEKRSNFLLEVVIREIGDNGRLAWAKGDGSAEGNQAPPLGKPSFNSEQAPAQVQPQESQAATPVTNTAGAQAQPQVQTSIQAVVESTTTEEEDLEDLPF